MELGVPRSGLVLLIGPAGAGKTTLARRLFEPTEIVSSDQCRALVSDRENDQRASADAFRLLHLIVDLRLKRRRLAVVDATNVAAWDRRPLLQLARGRGLPAVAIVLDVPLEVCLDRDAGRPERRVGEEAVRSQWETMQIGLPGLAREGFAEVHVLESTDGFVARRRSYPAVR